MNHIIKEDGKRIAENFRQQLGKLEHSNLLITGACGMIASYMAYILLDLAEEFDLEVYLQCRNLEKGRKTYEEFLETSSRIHLMDIPMEKPIDTEVGFDHIIHAASPASTQYFINYPVDVIAPNAIGTWNLLNYAREHSCKSVIFLSSNSIYGGGG